MKQYLGAASSDGQQLLAPARDLSHRSAALVIALTSCGMWVMLARLAAEIY